MPGCDQAGRPFQAGLCRLDRAAADCGLVGRCVWAFPGCRLEPADLACPAARGTRRASLSIWPNGLLDLKCHPRNSRLDRPSIEIHSNVPLTVEVIWEGGTDTLNVEKELVSLISERGNLSTSMIRSICSFKPIHERNEDKMNKKIISIVDRPACDCLHGAQRLWRCCDDRRTCGYLRYRRTDRACSLPTTVPPTAVHQRNRSP